MAVLMGSIHSVYKNLTSTANLTGLSEFFSEGKFKFVLTINFMSKSTPSRRMNTGTEMDWRETRKGHGINHNCDLKSNASCLYRMSALTLFVYLFVKSTIEEIEKQSTCQADEKYEMK